MVVTGVNTFRLKKCTLVANTGGEHTHTCTHIRARTHTQIFHLHLMTFLWRTRKYGLCATPAGTVVWVHRVYIMLAQIQEQGIFSDNNNQHFSRHSSTLYFRTS